MNKQSVIFLSFLIAVACNHVTGVTAQKVAIIVAGQSNAEGRVPAAQFPASFTDETGQTVNYLASGQIPNTKYANKDANANFGTWTLGTSNWAFDAIVLSRLQHFLDDTVYEIKWTQGGSAISPKGADTGGFWTAHFDEIPTGKQIYLKSFEQCVTVAMQKNPEVFDIKAFLWHQGEGDYQSPANGDYYVNFLDLITYVRKFTGNPTLPVIFGSISHKSAQYSSVVEAAQMRIAAEDEHAYLIDMSNATLLDLYHFDATNTERFGTEVYEIIRDNFLPVASGIENKIGTKGTIYFSGSDLIIDANNNTVEKVELINLQGTVVKTLRAKQRTCSLATLPAGVYVAKVTTNTGVFTAKVIK
jgi:hypothetical protein